jgi:hypothetical protein
VALKHQKSKSLFPIYVIENVLDTILFWEDQKLEEEIKKTDNRMQRQGKNQGKQIN